jgi:UDP-glucose 4-epimerase
MRALVTGGSGFVGSHLVDALVADGHEVTVLDDLSIGRVSNLAHHGNAVRLVEGTVLDESTVTDLVSGADVVWHLAAVVGVRNIVENLLHSMRVNAFGTEVVLNSCFQLGRKAVIISSSEVNGRGDRLPMHEDDNRVLGSTKIPRWSYATAKALDEHLALAYAQQGLPVVALRYFNSYGPRMDPRGYGSVVATFLNQALAGEPLTVLGDGTQTRCFTFVEDTARATALAGLTAGADGRVVNVGADDEITINELAAIVLEVTGSASPIVHVDPLERYGPDFQDTLRRRPDRTRARDLLGWEPTKTLRDGLAETVKGWEASND